MPEQHLNSPTQDISSIPNDTDYICALKTLAVIEPMLNDLIAKHPRKDLYGRSIGWAARNVARIERKRMFSNVRRQYAFEGKSGQTILATD